MIKEYYIRKYEKIKTKFAAFKKLKRSLTYDSTHPDFLTYQAQEAMFLELLDIIEYSK